MTEEINLEAFEVKFLNRDFSEAQSELSALGKNFDKNFYFLEAKGRLCLATNKTNEAFQNYRGALKVAGEIGSVRKDVLVRIYINCADICQKLGNPEQAKAYLEKGLQFDSRVDLLLRISLFGRPFFFSLGRSGCVGLVFVKVNLK